MRLKSGTCYALMGAGLMLTGCMSPVEWWGRLSKRVSDLSAIRARYEVLEKEYLELQAKHLELQHEHQSLAADLAMERARRQNQTITGHAEGRHLANITYTAPEKMPFPERARMAQEHINHRKFAEAFVLFESFLRVPEGAPYQNVDAFYNAGIAAFEIKNFNRAREYFEAVNSHGDGLRDMETLRRAKLWLRVLDRRENRGIASVEQVAPAKNAHGPPEPAPHPVTAPAAHAEHAPGHPAEAHPPERAVEGKAVHH